MATTNRDRTRRLAPCVHSCCPASAQSAEDDEAIRTSLAGLLGDDGFEVMTAATIERARPFDLQEIAATVVVAFENDVRPHLRKRSRRHGR
jgi:hypothetical protein